ncbi:MAG: Ig-like domain-containing protein [Vicinamibacterales bacterium]
MTLQSPLIAVTKTTTATGVATLGTGSSQSITSGWKSDSPNVATVSDSGVVTGVSNGTATIYVVFGGRQGQAQVRVMPNYPGQWQGTYIIRSCQTIDLEDIIANTCTLKLTPGTVLPVSFTLTQSGESVSGQYFYGSGAFVPYVTALSTPITFTPSTAPIEGDGSASLFATATVQFVTTIESTWRINSPADGQLAGSLSMTRRRDGRSLRLTADIVSVSRTSALIAPGDGH